MNISKKYKDIDNLSDLKINIIGYPIDYLNKIEIHDKHYDFNENTKINDGSYGVVYELKPNDLNKYAVKVIKKNINLL